MDKETLNNLYVLSHLHCFADEIEACTEEHVDYKEIGIFYDLVECLEVLERYKKLPGFKDHLDGFRIDEYGIDSIFNAQVSSLVGSRDSKALEEIYTLYYVEEFEPLFEKVKLLGIYSTEKRAQEAKKLLASSPEFAKYSPYLEIHENEVGLGDWQQGFTTV